MYVIHLIFSWKSADWHNSLRKFFFHSCVFLALKAMIKIMMRTDFPSISEMCIKYDKWKMLENWNVICFSFLRLFASLHFYPSIAVHRYQRVFIENTWNSHFSSFTREKWNYFLMFGWLNNKHTSKTFCFLIIFDSTNKKTRSHTTLNFDRFSM